MTHTSNDRLLYLTAATVKQICDEIDPVAIISQALALHAAGDTLLPDEAYLGWKNELNEGVRNLNMPSFLGGSFHTAGTKIINGNPDNIKRGLPRASGLTMLFDVTTGQIACIMDAAHISALRTASVSALAATLLAGPACECLAVIGAGALAAMHLDLLPRHLPDLKRILLFDLDPDRAAALVQSAGPALAARDLELARVETAEQAIRPAQVIVPVTTATVGYIPFDWLQPGAIVVHISLDDVLPEVVLKSDLVVVDDWPLVKADPRRLLGRMYRQGLILDPDAADTDDQAGRRRIDAELGQIVSGKKPGRVRPEDIVLVNPFGLSIEDIALATEVYRRALNQGYGAWLER